MTIKHIFTKDGFSYAMTRDGVLFNWGKPAFAKTKDAVAWSFIKSAITLLFSSFLSFNSLAQDKTLDSCQYVGENSVVNKFKLILRNGKDTLTHIHFSGPNIKTYDRIYAGHNNIHVLEGPGATICVNCKKHWIIKPKDD